MMRWSKSSPPRKVSPLVDSTSNCFSPSTSAISMIEMSKVPPPRSYTAILRSPLPCLSRPKASAAAVGSLMMRLTSRPAMRPASLVAWRCAVVEVGRHRDHGLGDFFAEVVLGGLLHLAQHFGADLRRRQLLAAHFDPGVAVVGLRRSCRASGRCPSALPSRSNLRPIRRLTAYSVFFGLVTAWRLAERADQDLAVFLVGDDRRRGARAFAVLDHLGRVAFHDRRRTSWWCPGRCR